MLLDVAALSLIPVKLLTPCKRAQHCWPTTPNIVGSYWVCLHVAYLLLKTKDSKDFCKWTNNIHKFKGCFLRGEESSNGFLVFNGCL